MGSTIPSNEVLYWRTSFYMKKRVPKSWCIGRLSKQVLTVLPVEFFDSTLMWEDLTGQTTNPWSSNNHKRQNYVDHRYNFKFQHHFVAILALIKWFPMILLSEISTEQSKQKARKAIFSWLATDCWLQMVPIWGVWNNQVKQYKTQYQHTKFLFK